MKFNNILKSFSVTIACLLLFPVILNSQTYSFRNYSGENIPNKFIYTISQSTDGFLWVGTGGGIFRFDGYDFFPVVYPDSVFSRNPTVSFKDKKGTLWFGSNDGKLYFNRDGGLVSLNVENSRSISEILQGQDGLIYIVPQGRAVISVNPENPDEIKKYEITSDRVMFSATLTATDELLIGSQGYIMACKLVNDSVIVKDIIEGFDYSSVTSIHRTDDDSRFIVGTEDNGLFQLRITQGGNQVTRFREHPEWSDLRVKVISEDSENNIWVSTLDRGVIQFKYSANFENIESVHLYNKETGLSSDDTRLTYQDAEGNIWFGLFGGGISMLTSYAFEYYTPDMSVSENNIIYINKLNSNYILGTPVGFHQFDPVRGKFISFTNITRQLGGTMITSYHLDKENNLWIGTDGNGLYVRNSAGNVRLFHRSGDSGADNIKDIEVDGNNIWLATINGVFVLDIKTARVKGVFNNSDGVLPHNSINKILISSDGKAYIGTESEQLYMIDRQLNVSNSNGVLSGSVINKVLSFTEGKDGVIWASTNGNGIFGCKNDSVSPVDRTNGLMSNYCYSILADSKNNIWTGHEKGFSRFDPATGVVNVFGADFAKGGVCNPDAMFESSDNKIFIGTTEGLIIYDSQKDRKSKVPPFNNITSVIINDKVYSYQKSYVLPYARYKIIVNYTGINFSAPDKVYYSTYLENWDSDWSKMTVSREETYNLRDGRYKFSVISVNENNLSQDLPVTFEIIIASPWWRKWWSILSAIILVAGTIIIIVRERDKAQKKIQDYLEKELDARTSVVMKQKGEIELQNIEITDSINYAKRIQSSILPDITKLKESFKDAFILFHPRDIVSGDFYWFDKLDDERFVLVCADSTGHGVPGAFMSMIGSTLLQDIVTRKRISKPSEILGLLDKQIFSTLNQNVELGVSNDGMDMVVCEFNLKTRHIRFASAMRPVIIVLDNEPFYIKGNRSSVGGESAIDKYFDDQEYYLSEGDTIYLFSDGLPDQFGGIDGKKMKIARLKRILEQVSKLPMSEQKEALSKFYYDWKGEYDQVDDVLLMGVRV
ncbi:MAG: SpoIIE family protein phosphatase [Bacteroidales bacterium]|nr:SpoIIE family protein phosphatase [Bacteroidales bacterium]